jgi:hypothetical protein
VRDGDIVVLRSKDGHPSHGAADGQAHPSCD